MKQIRFRTLLRQHTKLHYTQTSNHQYKPIPVPSTPYRHLVCINPSARQYFWHNPWLHHRRSARFSYIQQRSRSVWHAIMHRMQSSRVRCAGMSVNNLILWLIRQAAVRQDSMQSSAVERRTTVGQLLLSAK